jgi:hypothetical protein
MRKTVVSRARPMSPRPREVAVPVVLSSLLMLLGTIAAPAVSEGRSAAPDSGASADDRSAAATDSVLTSEIAGDTSDSLRSTERGRPPVDRVIVYYFHRTARCDNCLRFEAYASEALRDTFADQLAEGRLEWHAINLDQPENEHFVATYELVESSIIVSRFLDGEEAEWRSLDEIWELVGDKPAFMDYVSWEVGEDLRRLLERRHETPDALPLHRQLVPEPDGGGVGAPPQG